MLALVFLACMAVLKPLQPPLTATEYIGGVGEKQCPHQLIAEAINGFVLWSCAI